jgi:P4 family phage/plasmid primase-like protien
MEASVERVLRQKLPAKDRSSYAIKEVMADMCQSLHRPIPPEEPPWYQVNFLNGVWDVKRGGFIKLNGNDEPPFFLSQIPHKLDPKNSNTDHFDEIFKKWVPSDYVPLLYEIIGYILLRANLNSKFFILFGSGDNGKTTYASLVMRTVGVQNCTSLSMDDIVGDKFGLASLRGKLVNLTGELIATIKRTDRLKRLTGRDLVYAQEKFKAGFSFIPYAKFVFLGNLVPSTSDPSFAFYKRTQIVPFPYTIPREEQVPELIDLLPEEELQGLLGKIIWDTLPAFFDRNYRFSTDPSVEDLKEEWEGLSGPLWNFFQEYFEPATQNNFVPNFFLVPLFRDFCGKNGLFFNTKKLSNLLRKQGFKQELKRLSEEELKQFQSVTTKIPSPCRGWICNGVTLVTEKNIPLYMEIVNRESGKKSVTSVTGSETLDELDGGNMWEGVL